MKFQSNALWPDGVCNTAYGDNISTDTHPDRESAVAVCMLLKLKGFGGNRTHFPLKTWVSEVQQPPIIPEEPPIASGKDRTTGGWIGQP